MCFSIGIPGWRLEANNVTISEVIADGLVGVNFWCF